MFISRTYTHSTPLEPRITGNAGEIEVNVWAHVKKEMMTDDEDFTSGQTVSLSSRDGLLAG